ncbi:MAG: sialidase family protein [Woeseia sp.]
MNRLRTAFLILATGAALHGCAPESGEEPASLDWQAIDVPAAPDSSSPNLASGPDGTLTLSWLEAHDGGHSLKYAILDGEMWSAPSTVARGDNWFVNWADFPSVVPISDSLRAAHWLVRQPAGGYAYDVRFSLSADGGGTWSEPVMPHDDGTPTEHGFVTLFPQASGVGLVWLDGRNMANDWSPDAPLQGMTLRSATYESDLARTREMQVDELICDCCQTDVAVTDAGPVAVYRDRTPDETRDISLARFVDGEWQSGRPVANDGWTIGGCPVNGPAIAADGTRVAVAWFTAAGDEPKVRVARSSNSGESFSAPVDVTDGDVFGRVGIAMLNGGDVAVSWLCKESDDNARVCLRRVASGGQAGPVQIVSGDQDVSPLSVPQVARSGDFVIAAWTARDDAGSRVKSSRVAIASLP